jgi:hypothetical protein
MADHTTHQQHDHVHGVTCGHTAIMHGGHTDYLHDGHLHHAHGGHVDEHIITVDATNPVACTPSCVCVGHAPGFHHGPGCGHDAIPHGDHVDYIVHGHLHHVHDGHCDDHGPVHAV